MKSPFSVNVAALNTHLRLVLTTGDAIRSDVPKYVNPPAHENVQVRGRPQLGCYRLQAILPKFVLNELVKVESETEVYRTRVAANILCEWAKRQRSNKSRD